MNKILVTGTSVETSLLKPAEDAGFEIVIQPGDLDEDQLIKALEDCNGLIMGGEEFVSEKVIVNSPNLKVVSFVGVDYVQYIDTKAAKEHNITIKNTPGQNTESVAEFCVAQLISMNRSIYSSITDKDGAFKKKKQLSGSKIGIVGMGAIGSRVSQMLSLAFNCEIYYTSRTQKPEIEKRDNAKFVDFETLLGSCDSILFSPSSNKETLGMFNWHSLKSTKNPITIVNIANPNLLEPASVSIGLQEGKIESITYDVFYDEGTPGASAIAKYSPEKVIVTKHIANLTYVAWNAMASKAIENAITYLSEQDSNNNTSYRTSLG